MSGDTAKIRAAFIDRQLERAQELAAAARNDSGERARAARDGAAYIVNEFRRYCEWCRELLPEPERSQFAQKLSKVETSINRTSN